MANNTRYGRAASGWSENLNTALDIAPQLKAGTVWVNCTNLFDAASGCGGYRESGYGREGGKEGLWEYLREPAAPAPAASPQVERASVPIDSSPASQSGATPAEIASVALPP